MNYQLIINYQISLSNCNIKQHYQYQVNYSILNVIKLYFHEKVESLTPIIIM